MKSFAGWLAVLLPLTLTHFRALAEIDFDILAVLFLIASAKPGGTFGWVKRPWCVMAGAWWIWQVCCTVPSVLQGVHVAGGAFVQALVAIRFPLAIAALGEWILPDAVWRRRVLLVTFGCTLYIAAQMAFQAVFGMNIFGQPRFRDGTLTGPYAHPRAAAPLSRLILPFLMAVCACWGRWRLPQRFILQAGSLLAAVVLLVLAGQRMPLVLAVMGLGVCAVLYRPMRLLAVSSVLGLPGLVMMARLVSPASFHHLVTLTQNQLGHFAASPYGQIYSRVVVMVFQRPWFGYGYDGYRHDCAGAEGLTPPHWLHVVPSADPSFRVCVQHPHNLYAQALINGGLLGLCIFTALIACVLWTIWPGKQGSAVQIGLFAAVFIQYWPLTSSSDFLNLPLGGWGFMLVGLALSYKRFPFRDGFSHTSDVPISQPAYGGSHV
ncbi:O-antigen ligase family protein [Neokomagataea thailandica]|uniref:O-antigen ligase family protein n=1 Tax=Neokomagataea TaxID=1223423 RepID=UPI001FE0FC49|nr:MULTISPECIES: O-antigen ligase family protein [Neokomagataea]